MKKISILLLILLAISCNRNDVNYDATGVFETTEVTVSAEQTGKIIDLNIEEGDLVKADSLVGIIDTVQFYLKARQIGATKIVYSSQIPEIKKQLAALEEQLRKANLDVKRFDELVKKGAANSKTLDDAKNQRDIIEKQIIATKSTLNNSTNSLKAQMSTADVQQLQIADQLEKCHIYSPITGTILEKYCEPGEFAVVGKPLFKVSDLRRVYLRAYLTAEQVTGIKIGQKVKVYADQGESDRKEYDGEITWITEKAEFTPKTIQTRDERSNLVYAVKIGVDNDGLIKSGMYGDVRLH